MRAGTFTSMSGLPLSYYFLCRPFTSQHGARRLEKCTNNARHVYQPNYHVRQKIDCYFCSGPPFIFHAFFRQDALRDGHPRRASIKRDAERARFKATAPMGLPAHTAAASRSRGVYDA